MHKRRIADRMTAPENLPQLYKAIFEDDRRGQQLLDDLQRRFCKRPDPSSAPAIPVEPIYVPITSN